MKSKMQDKRYRASCILHLKVDAFVKIHHREDIYNIISYFALKGKTTNIKCQNPKFKI